ncbi:MAG: hypothetical protein QJR03_03295 [Sphaerobacter sp.]|nr:hypothetical protein [Sphaerobacter sp.]
MPWGGLGDGQPLPDLDRAGHGRGDDRLDLPGHQRGLPPARLQCLGDRRRRPLEIQCAPDLLRRADRHLPADVAEIGVARRDLDLARVPLQHLRERRAVHLRLQHPGCAWPHREPDRLGQLARAQLAAPVRPGHGQSPRDQYRRALGRVLRGLRVDRRGSRARHDRDLAPAVRQPADDRVHGCLDVERLPVRRRLSDEARPIPHGRRGLAQPGHLVVQAGNARAQPIAVERHLRPLLGAALGQGQHAAQRRRLQQPALLAVGQQHRLAGQRLGRWQTALERARVHPLRHRHRDQRHRLAGEILKPLPDLPRGRGDIHPDAVVARHDRQPARAIVRIGRVARRTRHRGRQLLECALDRGPVQRHHQRHLVAAQQPR